MRKTDPAGAEQRDLIDEAMDLPIVGVGLTRLQRMLAPSCLASLVILLLLVVLFRRWVHLPPVGMLALAMVVWMLTLGVMVRFRNRDPEVLEGSYKVIDREH